MAAIATSLLAGAASAPAATLTATALQTLDQQTAGANPSAAVTAGGVGYIAANDGTHGQELFRVDGTAVPRLVKDIRPGAYDSYPAQLTALGNDVYFAADDGTHGEELWRSDGTAAGTTLVDDIAPGSAGASLDQLVASGGKLYFIADDGTGDGQELWVSDGTAAGTHLVKDIAPGASISGLTPFDGGVAFSADDGTDVELWVSDGTLSGTTKVDVATGSASSYPGPFAAIGSELYFAADDGTGHNTELYKSDGTTASLVKDVDGSSSTSSYPDHLTVAGGALYFTAGQNGYGSELWTSDGTTGGTHLVKQINGGGNSDVNSLTALGAKLYFSADDGVDGYELWSSDGTDPGTTIVKDINGGGGSYPGSLAAVGSHLDFLADDGSGAGSQLWTTDGTAAGTTAITGTSGNAQNLSAIGSLLYFTDDDGIHGREPGISDGTAAGTVLHDVDDFGLSDPTAAVKLGDLRLFTAETGSGRRVFVTDGTAAGSHPLAVDGTGDTRDIAVMGGKAYFFGRDGNGDDALYATDGTDAGTQEIHTVQFYDAPDLTVVGDRLYFAGAAGFNTEEPWISDGTPGGTHRLADLNPTGMSHPSGFTALGNKVVFSAWNGGSNNDPTPWGEYVSDGTEARTVKLAPGANVGSTRGVAATLGSKTYFFANNHLWATDGTPSGTAEVTSAVTVPSGESIDPTVAGGKLYFNGNDGTGMRLFAYDGTGSPVALTAPTPNYAKAYNMIPFGGDVLFTDGGTNELSESGGTPAGTHGLGATVADSATFLVDGTKAWFTGTDGDHGDELWSTDGTAAGTALAADLVSGPGSSRAAPLAVVGDDVLVSADQPGTGTVLARLHAVTTPDDGGAQSGGQTTTTTAATPTTTTANPAPAKPAPAAKGRAKARGLSLTASRSAGRRLPLRIVVSGKLKPATGVTTKAACSGTVTIAARRGAVTIARVRVKLRSDCSYRATLTKNTMKHLTARGGTLKVTARFSGNAALLPARSATRTSSYGA